jgi:hypothetical protein
MDTTSGRKKLSDADKFSTLFDQDWKNTKSLIRTRSERQRTYDVSNSWDARSDNPQSFSRLEQTLVPFQKSKPIVLSGSAVVMLEETSGCNTLNLPHPAYERAELPLTTEQRDIGMAPDLSGNVAILESYHRNNIDPSGSGKRKTTIIVDKPATFMNGHMNPPVLKEIPLPKHYLEAGDHVNERLLSPGQRREIHEIRQKEAEAKEVINAAVRHRNKTKQQVSGVLFQRGISMVDSNANINSEIYGEKARIEMAEREYKKQIHLERQSNLANKQSSMSVYGNILVPDTLGPRVKLNKDYQSKGGNFHALSYDETHNRLFCRLSGTYASNRTQALRDVELSGKDYNITQHTTIEHWPPRSFEREYVKDMAHPSQQALEGPRNLQGTLRPF